MVNGFFVCAHFISPILKIEKRKTWIFLPLKPFEIIVTPLQNLPEVKI